MLNLEPIIAHLVEDVSAGVGGMLVGVGEFAWATGIVVIASLGDALDGLVARRSGAASIGGALLDSASDRYEETSLLGGPAVYFRGSVVLLVLTLGALAGSFMLAPIGPTSSRDDSSSRRNRLHLDASRGLVRGRIVRHARCA
jgi:phosphatidylglycerophosphate synthase